MKKIYGILFAGIFIIFSLSGCRTQGKPKGNPYFNATVLEIEENTILVKPFEYEDERKSGDKISVNTDVISTIDVPELEIGTEICVVYNGDIMESYPVRIKTVFAIYLLDENGEAIIPREE